MRSTRARLNHEMANGRTFGECVQAERDSFKLIDGEMRPTLYIINKPKRMNERDAFAYYNNKLRSIWDAKGK